MLLLTWLHPPRIYSIRPLRRGGTRGSCCTQTLAGYQEGPPAAVSALQYNAALREALTRRERNIRGHCSDDQCHAEYSPRIPLTAVPGQAAHPSGNEARIKAQRGRPGCLTTRAATVRGARWGARPEQGIKRRLSPGQRKERGAACGLADDPRLHRGQYACAADMVGSSAAGWWTRTVPAPGETRHKNGCVSSTGGPCRPPLGKTPMAANSWSSSQNTMRAREPPRAARAGPAGMGEEA